MPEHVTPTQPNPGSPEAVAQGCTCAVWDNANGQGAWGTGTKPDGEKLFWRSEDCPLHGEAVPAGLSFATAVEAAMREAAMREAACEAL